MAEENEDEKKSGGLMPLLKKIGIFGALIAIGLVIGYFFFSPASDVIEKEELEEMIERSIEEREAAIQAEEEANADPEKVSKDTPEEETFETIYYEFAGTFTTNLANSRKMLQLGLAVSTQYDDTVMVNVEAHELGLRSIILQRVGNFSEDDIKGEEGRMMLANSIRDALNAELEELEGFGGIEKVHFTSLVLQ
ncbi:MAG: flagellar basal body-associated FliL family protein [Candidatus Puniceispirillales bacterium]